MTDTRHALAAQREQFEAWCIQRWRGDRNALLRNLPDADDHPDEYKMGPIEFAWQAYRAALSAQPVAGAVAPTADEVRRAAFELCEFIEDIKDKPTDSQEVERFKAGQRYAAKSIRRGLGIWFVDEENSRKTAQAAPATEPSAQPVAGAVAEPDCWAILTPNGSKLVSPDEAKGRKDAYPLYAAPQPQAAPAPEPSRSQKMHEAGFTARDTRLTCDECGAKFTRQFAPLHECAQPEPSAQALDIAFELGRVEAMQETSAFNASALRKALSAMLTHFGMDEDEWNKPTLDQARAALAEYDSFTLHPATADLVRRFSQALAEKLAAAEAKYGYSDGWASPDWMDECRTKLMEHIAKGDPRDVAAYCAFLWHHGASTAQGNLIAPKCLSNEEVDAIWWAHNEEPTPTFRFSVTQAIASALTRRWIASAPSTPPTAVVEAVPLAVTDEMVESYLRANSAYWHQVDAMPRDITKPWRQGTPSEATRVSLEAALGIAPKAAQEKT